MNVLNTRQKKEINQEKKIIEGGKKIAFSINLSISTHRADDSDDNDGDQHEEKRFDKPRSPVGLIMKICSRET